MARKIITLSLLVLLTLPGAARLWAGDGGTLTPGEPVQGEIAERDEQDIYTFDGSAGEMAAISVSAAPDSTLDTVLELYDPEGALLETNDDTPFDDSTNSELRVTLPVDGEYRVVVLAFAGVSVGGYELLLGAADDEPPPETNEPEDLVIALGGAARGSLEAGEFDTWSFTAPNDGFIQITIFSSEFDSLVELLDADGILLEDDDDSGGGFNASIIGAEVQAGAAYEINARSFLDEGAGDYVITVTVSSPPPETLPIAYGDSLEGEVIGGLTTQFIFEGAQNDVVAIDVDGDFDGYLLLVDDSGVVLAEDDDSGEDLQPAITRFVLPDDGTYTIEVAGYSSFDAGQFTVTLNLLEDTVTIEGGAIAYGETVSGFANGDNPPNYTFEGSAGDQINVSVTAEFDGVLELYDPAGELIATDDDGGSGVNPRFTLILLPADGEYRMVLRAFGTGETGEYSLTLFAGASDAESIAMDSSVEGMLASDGVAIFQFEASAGDVVSVRVNSDFDPLLELRAANGDVIAQDDDSGGDLQPALNSVTLPENGQYVLVVTGFGAGDEGPFTLALESGAALAEPPVTDGQSIVYGDIFSGTIAGGAAESFIFSGQQGDVISIAIDSEFDGILDLYDPAGELLASDDDSGFDLNPLIEGLALPADGEYRAELGTFSGSTGGSYEIALILEGASDDGPTSNNVALMRYGETADGELSTESMAVFEFVAAAGDTVTIRVVADFDALIEVFDADANLIAGDDDSGDGLNPLIENLTLDADGTYTISVTSFDGQGRGEFALTLDADEAEITDVAAQVITPGERVQAALEVNTNDIYVFNAGAGDIISLAASSLDANSTLDLYLELYAPSGDLLLADDDSGWQFNPAMVGLDLPEEGTYRVEVQSFAGASEGDYVLSLDSGAVHVAPSGEAAQALPTDGGAATIPVDLSAGQSMAFVFSAAEGESLTANSTADNLIVDLYNSSGVDQPLVSGDGLTIPAEGEYVVVLYANADASGELQIALGEAARPLTITFQGNIAADVPIHGTLDENQIQNWIFTPMLGGDYTFSLSSEDADKRYDPFLILRDEGGNILAQDDDSGGEFNALVEGLTLPGGEPVTVEVHSFAEQSSGDYLLVVVTDRVEEPPIIAGGALAPGDEASNTLEFPSQQAEYSLDVADAGLFNLSVDGLKLPIIDIFDENDALVARGTASIKDQMLEAGSYRVLVYDRLNRTGDFTISLGAAE